MRIFRPLRSSVELISFLNQPPAWVPVLEQSSVFTPKEPASSSHSSWPPPYFTQAFSSEAVIPKGTVEK